MRSLKEIFPYDFVWRDRFEDSINDSITRFREETQGKKVAVFLSGGADSEFLARLFKRDVDYIYVDWGDPASKFMATEVAKILDINLHHFHINLDDYAANHHLRIAKEFWCPTLWTSLYFYVASQLDFDAYLKGGEMTLTRRDSKIVAYASRCSKPNHLGIYSDIILSNPSTVSIIAEVMEQHKISYDEAKVRCYEQMVPMRFRMKRTGFERFTTVALCPNEGPTWLERYPDFYFTVDEIRDEFSS